MILTLTQTVQRAKSGDKAAFGELYAHYYKEMYRYAYYALRHEQDAQDVVAETVACAYAQIGKLKKEEAFPMWLFKILSNQIKHKMRTYVKEKHTTSLEEISEETTGLSNEEHLDLHKALEQLHERDRQIVILSVIEGFTGNEIAKILQMNPATVRSRSFRAMKQLRQILSVPQATQSDRKEKGK